MDYDYVMGYEGGYNYNHGMSNRAVRAYNNGLLPLSKFSASDFENFDIRLNFAQWLAKNDYWKPSEWHHTGKHFNKTYFYNVEDLHEVFKNHNKEELLKLFKGSKNTTSKDHRVTGTYTTFYKAGRRYIPEKNDFSGTLKGNWIFLDGGGKKKADGKNITYHITQVGGQHEKV